ncbi:dTDP-4-amino-4,6-dideoxygalactose transaminase [Helicobacter trogontum]
MSENSMISFNKPFVVENELDYIRDAIKRGVLCGDGFYTKQCHKLLTLRIGCKKVLLTHSCTAALEMAAILLDLQTGDEVIMPSYTFVSTANAFVLRGIVPVFVDIREDTLNLNESLIESAITQKTKAIVCVHYAGVACEMDKILEIAKKYNLFVIEDAAQGMGSFYKGRPLGSIGDLGCFSFHETKNVISGEGGALIINNERFIERAEIIREKGTNRTQFFRGEVDKYTWVDIGSSFLPSDIIAAFLYSQLENVKHINDKRMAIWNEYDAFFSQFHNIQRPYVPIECKHNAHMYYVLFENLQERSDFIGFMKQNGIYPVFHYVPLHSSPAGRRFGRTSSEMKVTDKVSSVLVRMPLYFGMTQDELHRVFNIAGQYIKTR